MKASLYASLAANGLMLTADPSNPTPPALLADFAKHANEAGALILGRVTYEMALGMGAGDAFAGVAIVVVSSRTAPLSGPGHRVGSPAEALAHLAANGRSRALVGGGAVLYNAFLAESLVDEIYLNVLPTLSSRGKPIGAASEPQSLRLLSSTELVEGVTQLRFAVEARPRSSA